MMCISSIKILEKYFTFEFYSGIPVLLQWKKTMSNGTNRHTSIKRRSYQD